MRYIALLDRDRPIENPLMVVRIDNGREEVFGQNGWEPCDPVCRTWFVNVAITEEHAQELLQTVEPPGPLKDPQSDDLRYYAQTGYYDEWFYYAIEDAEHPFDDPVTTVRQHWTSGQEEYFTPDLGWKLAKATGRRIRVTQADAYAFEQIQTRRNVGNAAYGYFAIVNLFEPDVNDPPCIARESHDGVQEHYAGEWVPSSAINNIRHRGRDGTLVQLTEETAATLIKNWRPREERTRFFACLDKAKPDLLEPRAVVRMVEDCGSLRAERTSHDGIWRIAKMPYLLSEFEVVEVKESAVERLIERYDRFAAFDRPRDVRYRYFAVVRFAGRDDVMEARTLLRTWGGDRGTSYEEVYHPDVDRWRHTILLYEIHYGHSDMDDIEITEKVAEQLRKKLRKPAR